MKISKQNIITALLSLIIPLCSFGNSGTDNQPDPYPVYLAGKNRDSVSYWVTFHNDSSTIQLILFTGQNGDGIQVNYQLHKDPFSSGWVTMSCNSFTGFNENTPVTMLIKADAESDIELKFTDEDGSVFIKRYPIGNRYHEWTQIVVYLKNTFYQRRSDNIIQEDTLVLGYLKVLQDFSSIDARVIPNQEGSDMVSTFNSSLAAMSFIISDQKERAERILGFYAAAIDPWNINIEKQNFYYRGVPLGFYQQMNIKNYNRGSSVEDRWIGDMAWLLIAYKQYEQKYGIKPQYSNFVTLLRDLIISNYKNTGGDCGCIQTGWQDGDTRFDTTCHDEGNIDCYAALKACRESVYSQKIGKWVNNNLKGYDRPLDNYTWRVMTFGDQADTLLRIPEYDFRYRKKVFKDAIPVYGFYTYPDINIKNIWTEGTGHMACAQFFCGNQERGNFYSNQLDPLLLEYNLYGKNIKTLPYAVNQSGEFVNLDTTKGTISSAS